MSTYPSGALRVSDADRDRTIAVLLVVSRLGGGGRRRGYRHDRAS